MRLKKLIVTALTLILFGGELRAQARTQWSVVKTFHIGFKGAWDYLTVDPQTRRLYVPRTTHTMVIDATSGKILADISGQNRAHGVAIALEAGRGFISDGGGGPRTALGDGAIVMFDLKTNKVLTTIVSPPDTDGIIFDRGSGRVLVVSGDKGVLMLLKPDADPGSAKIEASIKLDGAPEFLAADGAGKVYINLMDKNEVAEVDLYARKVIARWPVAPGGAPVGMAIDTKKRLLFIGCRDPQKLIVMSADDGKVLADLPIGPLVDATKTDGAQAFASCGDGTLTVVAGTAAGKFEIVQTVKTAQGSRTMGVDPVTHAIYLPTAEFEALKPGAAREPPIKPATFKILVVARK